MRHSSGDILFSQYLIKKLEVLNKCADNEEKEYYEKEYKKAEVKKEKTIDRWRERHLNTILTDDSVSLYRIWFADIMNELSKIDQETI